MEKQSGNRAKLGMFVTAGIALFIGAIYFIGEKQQLFNKTFRVSCVFKDISGLQNGNNVRFSGLTVGIVDAIEQITDSTVRVEMIINEKSKKFIKKTASATVGSDGLMGNKIILIAPGEPSNDVIANNDTLRTLKAISMDEILAKIKVTTDNAAEITGDLSIILKGIRGGKGAIGKFFSDTAFAKNIDQTVANIKTTSTGLKDNMDAAKHSFLLKGFFKRKERKAQKAREKMENEKAEKGQK